MVAIVHLNRSTTIVHQVSHRFLLICSSGTAIVIFHIGPVYWRTLGNGIHMNAAIACKIGFAVIGRYSCLKFRDRHCPMIVEHLSHCSSNTPRYRLTVSKKDGTRIIIRSRLVPSTGQHRLYYRIYRATRRSFCLPIRQTGNLIDITVKPRTGIVGQLVIVETSFVGISQNTGRSVITRKDDKAITVANIENIQQLICCSSRCTCFCRCVLHQCQSIRFVLCGQKTLCLR